MVTRKFVGYDLKGLNPGFPEQIAEESQSSFPVPLLLNQNVDLIPILIDGSPQIVSLPANFDEYLVEMPDIAGSSGRLVKSPRIRGGEFQTPHPDSFVADLNSSGSEQLFDFPVAEGESMVEPYGVTDD